MFPPYLQFNRTYFFIFGLCLSLLAAFWVIPVDAQRPINTLNTSFDLTPDTSDDYSINGAGNEGDGSQTFLVGTTYDLRFNTNTGNRRLDSFAIGGTTFMRLRQADQIIVRRSGNADTSTQRHRWFAEADLMGTTIDVFPGRADTPEEILADNIINHGVLDTFLNRATNPFPAPNPGPERENNIERVDVLFTAGIVAPVASVLNNVGFAAAEKNGNNPFQIAAITAVDGGGNPTAYGNLVLVTQPDYGITNVMSTNTWFENDRLDSPLGSGDHGLPRPYGGQPEPIGAVFISFLDLGLSEGQTFFGYSMFADDVVPGTHDLTDVSTFPQDTGAPNGGDHYGGFMEGLFTSALPPVAVDDSSTTPLNTPVTFSATNNDTDLDGTIDPSTVDLDPNIPGQQTTFAVPAEGTFTVAANGDVTFTPELDFTGISTIPYTVNDNEGFVSNVANLAVTVTAGANTPPVAVDDSATTPLDTPVTFSATNNDTDADGVIDPATVDLDPNTPGQQTTFAVPGEGTFTVDAAGNVTFTPEVGFTGTSSIPYTVNDDGGATSNQATLTVVINAPPVANDDQATTPINTPVTLSTITANDTDIGGTVDASTVDLDPSTPGRQTTFTVPGEGTFVVDNNGDVVFTPVLDFTGTSTIPYTVNDNDGATSNPANLIVIVEPNTPPTAVDDSAVTPLDTPVTLAVIANDSDADGTIDPATTDLDPNTPGRQTTFAVPGEGTFTADDSGNVTFTPEAGFTGTSTIPYTVNDDDGATSNNANITVTVQASNIPPIANDDSGTTPLDTPITLSIIANDTDADGTVDPATTDLDPNTPGRQTTLTVPGEGTFTADDNGNVTFTPEAGFTGTSTIPYTVNDDDSETSNNANITITVQADNVPPVANDDSAVTPVDTPVTLGITGNDTDADGTIDPATTDLDPNTPGRQTTFTVPGEGTFVADDNGNVTFTPEAGFTGISTIPYTVNDDEGDTSNNANITITVTNNAPPVAVDDSTTTPLDTPVTLSVITNDSDADGTIDPATVDLNPSIPGRQTIFTVPGEGVFTTDDSGNVTFTPEAGFTGTSTIPYTVNDDGGLPSNNANIAITVETPTPPNTPPVTGDDSATTQPDTPVTITVLVNDNDPDGTLDPATIDLDPNTPGRQTTVTVPGEGTFTTDDNGNVTFTPEPGFTGTSMIPYTVNDDDGETSNIANIVVTVEGPANTPPIAVDDSDTTTPETPVTITVLTNDSDLDGDPITVTQITQPTSGTATLNPDGTITYTPAPDTVGPVTFTYTISDGRGGMDTATVTVNLTNVFDPPSGRKTVSFTGRPELEWRMVWINAGNVAANAVRIEDEIIANTTYADGSLTCEARGDSTVERCEFDAAANRVVYEGVIAADPGAATEDEAVHEVVITFRVAVSDTFFGPLVNQAMANWDANDNGSPADDIAGGQPPVVTDDPASQMPGDGTLINIPPLDPTEDNEEGDNPDEGGFEDDDGFES